jgi:hypothetical protein
MCVIPDKKTQIVIVGGGAAGLELARKLGARYGRKRHDIILIDRNRTHIWKPLLHEVATGSLDASLDEVGYRSHCHRWGYRYLYGTLQSIDRSAQRVHIAPVFDPKGREVVRAHSVRYDYLVLAYGSVTNDFGTPGVADNCLFLDSRGQADSFRDQLLDHCLRVSRAMSADPASDARVRIAIVGGGAGLLWAGGVRSPAAGRDAAGSRATHPARLARSIGRRRARGTGGAGRQGARRCRRDRFHAGWDADEGWGLYCRRSSGLGGGGEGRADPGRSGRSGTVPRRSGDRPPDASESGR